MLSKLKENPKTSALVGVLVLVAVGLTVYFVTRKEDPEDKPGDDD